jgi:hypothetical protein
MDAMNLLNELLAAMADGLEVTFIPVRMSNEEQTLKGVKIRVIEYRDEETVSISREIDVGVARRSQKGPENSFATELMVARTKVIE